MSNIEKDNETAADKELPVQDELTSLKARADLMGIQYHPSIGLEKLRDKVNGLVTTDGVANKNIDSLDNGDAPSAKAEVVAVPVEESPAARRVRKKREANELVRVRVACMNPAKKEWEGEIFTTGNSLVGSFSKFVPFNNEEGWHIPRIIYNMVKDRQCQVFISVKDGRGNSVRKGKLIREFTVEILPELTVDELHALAQRQAMAKTFD